MEAVTSEQMYAIDRKATREMGVPEIILMENAGRGIVEAALHEFGTPKNAVVVCGKGNNGGDGAVAARHLKTAGSEVKIFIIGTVASTKGSARINLDIASSLGIPVIELLEEAGTVEFVNGLLQADLVIDAIFGLGLKNDVSGFYKDVIGLMNSTEKMVKGKRLYRIVSADIPSGINSDTGEIMGCSVEADMTVTFHIPKTGLLRFPGLGRAGKIMIADIGIPVEDNTEKSYASNMQVSNITDQSYVKGVIPIRNYDSNKGDNGRVMIIAGSAGMAGAAVLSSRAALRTGSGLVYLSSPASIHSDLTVSNPEVILYKPLSVAAIRKMKLDVLAVGPGLGSKRKAYVLSLVKAGIDLPFVIDADALNSLASSVKVLKSRKAPTVITPHPGEMARLTGLTVQKVQEDRVGVAVKAAAEWNCTVVLKGSNTVIADPSGRYFINPTGNPSMATAGSGDVLTGMIASFIGQGIKPFDASVAGAYLHGAAGDVVASLKGQRGLIAGDIVEAIPYLLKGIGA